MSFGSFVNVRSNTRDCNGSKLGFDQACLQIVTDKPVSFWSQYEECEGCILLETAKIPETRSLILETTSPLKYAVRNDTGEICSGLYQFGEFGQYTLNITDGQTDCTPQMTAEPNAAYLQILSAVVVLLSMATLWYIIKGIGKRVVAGRVYAKYFARKDNELGSETRVRTTEASIPRSPTRSRLRSLDTFRGFCIALMIFLHAGRGYGVFKFCVWNGLTVNTVAFPWFAFAMGEALVLSLNARLRTSLPRIQALQQVATRSLRLSLIGIVLGSFNSSWVDVRLPGVLQRLAAMYFIVGALECAFMRTSQDITPGRSLFRDISAGWQQWLATLVLVAIQIPNLLKARQKCKKAESESELATDQEEDSRKRKKKTVCESDSESDGENVTGPVLSTHSTSQPLILTEINSSIAKIAKYLGEITSAIKELQHSQREVLSRLSTTSAAIPERLPENVSLPLKSGTDITSLEVWLENEENKELLVCITLLVPAPGCPRGYMGPGGLHMSAVSNVSLQNCTGGIAGYIDRLILGEAHMIGCGRYKMYRTTIPHDSHGILGILSGVLVVQAGAHATRIMLAYNHARARIMRWVFWSIIFGVAGGALSMFSKNGGPIPVNWHLWSLSFCLVMSSMALFIQAALYFIVDLKTMWGGRPLCYAGQNALILYIGHQLLVRNFPFYWELYSPTHAETLATKATAVILWLAVGVALHRRRVFITL